MSQKTKLINQVIFDGLLELEQSDCSDEDNILDDLCVDISILMSYRYSVLNHPVPKSTAWFLEVLPQLDDKRFKQILRVTRFQFSLILDIIKDHEAFNGVRSKRQFNVSTQLAIVLFRLGVYGDGSSVTKIASLFGIGDGGTIDRITRRVFLALSKEDIYVYWPSVEERNEMVQETAHELPKCIGYLDGTEINLAEAPVLDHVSYYSRKQRYSVKLQAVCDYKLRIRHIFVGFPGSAHDGRDFSNSDLPTQPAKYFSDNQWSPADSAYKLTDTVITPFRKNSTFKTSKDRQRFNKFFSSFRVRIEHAFGIMKEKFASLKEIRVRIKDRDSHKFVCEWVRCCVILHNLILTYLDPEDLVGPPEEKETDVETNTGAEKDDETGNLKRQALFDILFENCS